MLFLDDSEQSNWTRLLGGHSSRWDSEYYDREIERCLKQSFVFRVLIENRLSAASRKRVVTLTGTARDVEEECLAVSTAESLSLVTRIENQIEVEIDTPSGMVEALADRIVRYLAMKANVEGGVITIEIREGIVILKGRVDNPVRKVVIESLVEEVEGVSFVQNEIEVDRTVTAGSIQTTIDDASVSGMVKCGLSAQGLQAEVVATDGVLILTGTASNYMEWVAIGEVAQSIRGVKWVHNRMRIDFRENRIFETKS